jgi:hypothetical protein
VVIPIGINDATSLVVMDKQRLAISFHLMEDSINSREAFQQNL